MAPLKTLFWMNTPTFGGTERMNLRIMRGLAQGEFSVDALFFERDRPDLLGEFRTVCGNVSFVSDLGAAGTFAALRAFDVVYAFGSKANLLARAFKAVSPRTRVLSSLHSVIPHTDLGRTLPVRLDRLSCGIADAYISNSRSNIRYLRGRFGYPRRAHVIEHGIAPEEFAALAPRFPLGERFGFSRDCPVVVTVGSLNRIKNQAMLLDAIARSRRKDIRAFIVGKGALATELESRRDRLGLRERVWILQGEPEIGTFLAQADVFVSTSLVEGLPGAILEAMAAGVPVVATDVFGNDEVVREGETGRLVKLGDAPALASAVETLLDYPERAEELADGARKMIRERFTIGRTIDLTSAALRGEFSRLEAV